MSIDIPDEAVEAARDAVVREQHEWFRAAQRAVGVEPRPYDQLSERTKRLKHQQLDGLADAALAAALPVLERSIRDSIADELDVAARSSKFYGEATPQAAAQSTWRLASRVARGAAATPNPDGER